jgi:hypothetical protein
LPAGKAGFNEKKGGPNSKQPVTLTQIVEIWFGKYRISTITGILDAKTNLWFDS